ncbi:MAG: TIGR00282 family metallophosphoesterase [Candidatus Dojkabacteria bacterium]
MRILFIGDVSGRPGREMVGRVLPKLKKQKKIDLVIANAENSAGGIGITIPMLTELQGYGVDFFTSGDHVWKDREFIEELNDANLPLVRPLNYEAQEQLPGKGYDIIDMGSKGRVVVTNFLGQTFMNQPVRNPFWRADELMQELEEQGINSEKDVILIDFHAEATAEKISFGYYLSDKVTAVLGTHTHVPTSDERLVNGMAYVTDVGMVGPLDASLWADFENIVHNFKFPFKRRMKMKKNGRIVFNSVLIETKKGEAVSIERIDKIDEV